MLNIGFLYVSRVLQTYIKTLKFQYVAVVEFYIHYKFISICELFFTELTNKCIC